MREIIGSKEKKMFVYTTPLVYARVLRSEREPNLWHLIRSTKDNMELICRLMFGDELAEVLFEHYDSWARFQHFLKLFCGKLCNFLDKIEVRAMECFQSDGSTAVFRYDQILYALEKHLSAQPKELILQPKWLTDNWRQFDECSVHTLAFDMQLYNSLLRSQRVGKTIRWKFKLTGNSKLQEKCGNIVAMSYLFARRLALHLLRLVLNCESLEDMVYATSKLRFESVEEYADKLNMAVFGDAVVRPFEWTYANVLRSDSTPTLWNAIPLLSLEQLTISFLGPRMEAYMRKVHGSLYNYVQALLANLKEKICRLPPLELQRWADESLPKWKPIRSVFLNFIRDVVTEVFTVDYPDDGIKILVPRKWMSLVFAYAPKLCWRVGTPSDPVIEPDSIDAGSLFSEKTGIFSIMEILTTSDLAADCRRHAHLFAARVHTDLVRIIAKCWLDDSGEQVESFFYDGEVEAEQTSQEDAILYSMHPVVSYNTTFPEIPQTFETENSPCVELAVSQLGWTYENYLRDPKKPTLLYSLPKMPTDELASLLLGTATFELVRESGNDVLAFVRELLETFKRKLPTRPEIKFIADVSLGGKIKAKKFTNYVNKVLLSIFEVNSVYYLVPYEMFFLNCHEKMPYLTDQMSQSILFDNTLNEEQASLISPLTGIFSMMNVASERMIRHCRSRVLHFVQMLTTDVIRITFKSEVQKGRIISLRYDGDLEKESEPYMLTITVPKDNETGSRQVTKRKLNSPEKETCDKSSKKVKKEVVSHPSNFLKALSGEVVDEVLKEALVPSAQQTKASAAETEGATTTFRVKEEVVEDESESCVSVFTLQSLSEEGGGREAVENDPTVDDTSAMRDDQASQAFIDEWREICSTVTDFASAQLQIRKMFLENMDLKLQLVAAKESSRRVKSILNATMAIQPPSQ